MPKVLDYRQLKDILPQAFPFVLIDRVEDYQPGQFLIATKNITANEWVFEENSFEPIYYPETLLIEAAAQAALVLYALTYGRSSNVKYILTKITSSFRCHVLVGDQIFLKAVASKMLIGFGFMDMRVISSIKIIGNVQIFYKIT